MNKKTRKQKRKKRANKDMISTKRITIDFSTSKIIRPIAISVVVTLVIAVGAIILEVKIFNLESIWIFLTALFFLSVLITLIALADIVTPFVKLDFLKSLTEKFSSNTNTEVFKKSCDTLAEL